MKQLVSSKQSEQPVEGRWQVGDQVELTVERAALGGRLLGYGPDGRVVWVNSKQPLAPGDLVLSIVHKVTKRSAEVNVIQVIAESDDRVATFCDYVALCGGCPWQAISEEKQVETLQRDIDRMLSRATQLDVPWLPAWRQETQRWRSTARLHTHGSEQLGFYGPTGLIDLPSCAVFADPLPRMLDELRSELLPVLKGGRAELRLSAAHEASSGTVAVDLFGQWERNHLNEIERQLERLCLQGGPLHGASLEAHTPRLLQQFKKGQGVNRRSSLASRTQGRRSGGSRKRRDRQSKGRSSRQELRVSEAYRQDLFPVEKTWGKAVNLLTTPHHAGAFMQAHQSGNLALVQQVLLGLGDAKQILELYAGSGNFSAPMARSSQERVITALEFDPRAVASLNMLAETEQLSINGHAQSIDQLPEGDFDHVLLDPPRAGAAPIIHALAQAHRQGVQGITYISCHPAALARDLEVLAQAGWRLVSARLFHLFPHSGHAEVYCLLKRT